MSLLIRKATVEDISEIAVIHVDGWHGAYGGIIDQDFIESLTVEWRIEDWKSRVEETETWIAFQNGVAAGFVSFGSLRTPPPGTSKIRPLYSSEIYALYLKQDFYRQAIGTKLLKKSVEELSQQKHKSLCLWVIEKNKRARSFYEVMGGQRIGKRMVEIGPSNVKELCYGWRDISAITAL